ncbi:MAG: protein-methionine-sulfoxide reductase catalytic subunit MsrP [Rhodospirillaceae bacterium]|nr:protein-methionine-sulfoxide reductase catalytic subunit MsrP [Rhodospirillaceae bacterium]
MLIKKYRGWEIPEGMVTPESIFLDRRAILQKMVGPAIAAILSMKSGFVTEAYGAKKSKTSSITENKFRVPRNFKYTTDRSVTDEFDATTYNNFYEFGSHKSIYRAAQALKTSPWTVTFDGLVEKEQTIDWDSLISRFNMEERVYRHRCVEAWSMVVPWVGFPLSELIAIAKPLSTARFIIMETVMDPSSMPGQRQHWYPWPYTEGLTIEEATNELAFIATGVYGKVLPKQMGAPVRLVVPWKYGFKSIKSIVRVNFSAKRPVSFWEKLQPKEYGFWANVNPKVDHPRWSQARERTLAGATIPTTLYNGYADYVAHLYSNLKKEKLFM